jgi:hypothetical protein
MLPFINNTIFRHLGSPREIRSTDRRPVRPLAAVECPDCANSARRLISDEKLALLDILGSLVSQNYLRQLTSPLERRYHIVQANDGQRQAMTSIGAHESAPRAGRQP